MKNLVGTLDDQLVMLATSLLKCGKISRDHYIKRFEILSKLSIFKSQTGTRHYLSYDFASNVAILTEYLLPPKLFSYSMSKACSCGYNFNKSYAHVPVDSAAAIGNLENRFQSSINALVDMKCQCPKCLKPIIETRKFGPIFLIDMSLVSMDELKFDNRVPFTLESIDRELLVKNDTYRLIGAVHYISYGKDAVGHYTAYYYNGQNWYEYDDTSDKRTSHKQTRTITPHLVYYVRVSAKKTCRRILGEVHMNKF